LWKDRGLPLPYTPSFAYTACGLEPGRAKRASEFQAAPETPRQNNTSALRRVVNPQSARALRDRPALAFRLKRVEPLVKPAMRLFVLLYSSPVIPDFSLTLQDYSLTLQDFNLTLQDFSLAFPDFSLTLQGFSLTPPNFSLTPSGFSLTLQDFSLASPDCSLTLPDFSLASPDFSLTPPDFNLTLPDFSPALPLFPRKIPCVKSRSNQQQDSDDRD
jgi:hypothetical protein